MATEAITTALAQRRLLAAIGGLRDVPVEDCGESGDPFISVAHGLEFAASLTAEAGQPHVARIYINLGSLLLAVRADLLEKTQ